MNKKKIAVCIILIGIIAAIIFFFPLRYRMSQGIVGCMCSINCPQACENSRGFPFLYYAKGKATAQVVYDSFTKGENKKINNPGFTYFSSLQLTKNIVLFLFLALLSCKILLIKKLLTNQSSGREPPLD